MLLGNVGVYPIKYFMLWMWGYNCLLNVLELKFLCCTTICVDCGMLYYYLRRLWNVVLLLFVVFVFFFCLAKTVSSGMEMEKFLLNGLHLLIIGKVSCPFFTLLVMG